MMVSAQSLGKQCLILLTKRISRNRIANIHSQFNVGSILHPKNFGLSYILTYCSGKWRCTVRESVRKCGKGLVQQGLRWEKISVAKLCCGKRLCIEMAHGAKVLVSANSFRVQYALCWKSSTEETMIASQWTRTPSQKSKTEPQITQAGGSLKVLRSIKRNFGFLQGKQWRS